MWYSLFKGGAYYEICFSKTTNSTSLPKSDIDYSVSFFVFEKEQAVDENNVWF